MKVIIQDVIAGKESVTKHVEEVFDRYGVEFLTLCINHKIGSGYVLNNLISIYR
jgi:bloom syndrome protein